MHTYPLLTHIAELYQTVNLSNVLFLACQHLLNPQKKMFEFLLQLGLKPENCVIIGKNYSTNTKVMEDLENLGCIIAPFSNEFEPAIPFDVWFEYKTTSFIRKQLSCRKLEDYEKIIVLDDGGFLHVVVNRLCEDFDKIIGIEQTSSGHHKIEENKIRFQTVSVARSREKLILESPHIARNICTRVEACLRLCSKRNSKILVSGLGYIGILVKRGLHRSGRYQVTGFDPKPMPKQNINIMDAFEVSKNISKFDVIIGASGYSCFKEDDLKKMNPDVTLISASSSDREFPATMFSRSIHSIHSRSYFNNQSLINGGFPITFDGKTDAAPPAEIEFTIALLFINILNSVRRSKNGLLVQDVITTVQSMWEPRKGSRKWWNNFHAEINKEIEDCIITEFMSPF